MNGPYDHLWRDPAHWSGPRWLSLYFCKEDPRTWVPKRIPAMGWTLNLGRTSGVLWLIGILVAMPLLVILAVALGAPR